MSRKNRLERLERRPDPGPGAPPWDELADDAPSAYWDRVPDPEPDVLEMAIEIAGRADLSELQTEQATDALLNTPED